MHFNTREPNLVASIGNDHLELTVTFMRHEQYYMNNITGLSICRLKYPVMPLI
jgi:hypothetical protein